MVQESSFLLLALIVVCAGAEPDECGQEDSKTGEGRNECEVHGVTPWAWHSNGAIARVARHKKCRDGDDDSAGGYEILTQPSPITDERGEISYELEPAQPVRMWLMRLLPLSAFSFNAYTSFYE